MKNGPNIFEMSANPVLVNRNQRQDQATRKLFRFNNGGRCGKFMREFTVVLFQIPAFNILDKFTFYWEIYYNENNTYLSCQQIE